MSYTKTSFSSPYLAASLSSLQPLVPSHARIVTSKDSLGVRTQIHRSFNFTRERRERKKKRRYYLVSCSYGSAVRLGPPSRFIVGSLIYETLLSVSRLRIFCLSTIRLPALVSSKDVFHLSSVSWNVLAELTKTEAVLN